MEFIKPGTNINFIGNRRIAFVVSGALILATIFLLIWRGGPDYGVDFTGGVLIQVKFEGKTNPAEIKNALKPVGLQDSIVQGFGEGGSEYLIRINKTDIDLPTLSSRVEQSLKSEMGKGVEVRRVEMVGPKVGSDLRQKALFAIFYAILFIAIYISGRFELKWLMSIVMALALAFVVYITSSFGMSVSWLIVIALIVTLGLCYFLNLKYALGAIIALVHDVTITIGFFAFFEREISLTVIAALLTIVGYSLNDTIIVFDRIRENSRRFKRRSFEQTMNISINETLSRTILTSSTTLFVVLTLFFLGGGVIHDFAFALLVGIIVGTYSSIFVASPILLVWEDKSDSNTKEKVPIE